MVILLNTEDCFLTSEVPPALNNIVVDRGSSVQLYMLLTNISAQMRSCIPVKLNHVLSSDFPLSPVLLPPCQFVSFFGIGSVLGSSSSFTEMSFFCDLGVSHHTINK